MNPALASLLLAFPYIMVGIAMMVMGWAAGGFAYAALTRFNALIPEPWYYRLPGAGILLLLIRIASGFALMSWLASVLGVLGLFTLPLLLVLILPVILLGFFTAARLSPRHRSAIVLDQIYAGEHWNGATRGEKILVGGVVLFFCAIIVNTIIGALVPDMNQDPMWYHLPLPQQWVFDHRFGVYPNALQSAYPLAAEALFAVILCIGGNAVMCSLLTAGCGLCYLSTVAASAWATLGCEDKARSYVMWGVVAVMGVCIPLLVPYAMLAPLQPKNDLLMSFWACAGVMVIFVPLMAVRQTPPLACWGIGGFLLGTAICAKPSVINMVFFFMVFAALVVIFSEKKRAGNWIVRAFVPLLTCVLAMLIAAAPWLIRGSVYVGVPLYPIGTSFFTLKPDFVTLNENLWRVQSVVESGSNAWIKQVLGLPHRFWLGAQSNEKFVFIYFIVATVGVFATRGPWRWLAFSLFLHTVLIVGYKGAVEVFRYFSPSYILAIPLAALLVARAAPLVKPRLRYLASIAILVLIAYSVVKIQVYMSTATTFDWKFRPVLAKKDVKAYAGHAEMGFTYLTFGQLQNSIGKDERVFLLGVTYPYYLHRNTLWNDEMVLVGGVEQRWRRMNSEEARALLKKEKINVILDAHYRNQSDMVKKNVSELIDLKVLKEEKLPANLDAKGWKMFRVVPSE